MSKLFKKSIISFVLLLAFLLTNISPAFASTGTSNSDPEQTITAVEPTLETVKEQVTPTPDPAIEEVKEEPIKETPAVAPPVVVPPVKEVPLVEEPVEAPPVKEVPLVEEPVEAPPVKEVPQVEEPVEAPSVIEVPPVEEPVEVPPVKEVPLVEEPVEAPSVIEAPPAEEPVVAAPVKETISGKPLNPDHLNLDLEISNKPFNITLPIIGKSSKPKSSIVKSNLSIIGTPTTAGQVTIDKFAVPVEGMVNTWDVTLRIEGMDSEKSSDIVLVIDRSGSMAGTKLAGAKTAAKAFVEALKAVPNTRIAVVSFASQYDGASTVMKHTGLLDVTDEENRGILDTAISNLVAKGGTNTQAGIKAGAEVLEFSPADQKNMILLSDGIPTQSYKIEDVGTKLEAFTGTVETETGDQTGGSRTKTTMIASDYDYTTTVGSGSAPYTRIGSKGTNYYSHSNSAIAQAAMFKILGNDHTLWTIALETDSNGNTTLNSIASPDKASTANTDDLLVIFGKIAGSINAAAKNITVTDPMGPGFVPSNIVVSQGTTSGAITWNVGDLFKAVSSGSKVKYAEMTYRVTITDAILAETALDSKYPTNGDAKVEFTNSGGKTQTKTFPVPNVNPIFLKVKKTLLDASGNPVTAASPLFSINIKNNSSSEYTENFSLSPNQQKTSTKLRLGDTYTISEITSDYDVTFKVNGVETNTFTVQTPSGKPLADSGQNDIEVEVINQEKTRDIIVTKVWEGGKTPRDPITINLLADGVEVKEYTLPNGILTHTFTGLPVRNENGTKIVYTISEDTVPGYITTYNQTTFTVTNKFDVGKKDIPVSKVWLDGPSPKPSVTINLLADGVEVEHYTLPSGTLTYTFTNQPIYKFNGDLILYTISEDTVDGYTPTYNQTTLTVSNKFDVGKKDIPVNKIWVGGSLVKPAITINLMADGVDVDSMVLENGTTEYTFKDVPVYNSDGTTIVYAISENFVPGYISSIEGFTATNKFDVGSRDISVTKVWEGGIGARPTITINLLADGIEVAQVNLSPGDTEHTFTKLPVFKSDGTAIVYTVTEDPTENYETTVEGFKVINTWNGELPYTGTNTSTTLPIVGVLLALSGVALVMRRKRNNI